MSKVIAISILLLLFIAYSYWVYTPGTESAVQMTENAINGKAIWHRKNCQNCHQVFGLGGYMGPDLTTITKDKNRGPLYAKGMLLSGGTVMPNFHFSEKEADELVAYLDYISNTVNQSKP